MDELVQQLETTTSSRASVSETACYTFKRWQTFIALILMLISVGAATWRSTTSEARMQQVERDEFHVQASNLAAALERQVTTSVSSMYALAAMVEVDGGAWLEHHFDKIAQTMLDNYRGISNFDIAPFAVVLAKVPLQGNEGAIGHAMLSDYRRIEATLNTIRQKKALLDGPLKLIQGGTAVIARYPVFTRFSPEYIPDIRSWWPSWSHACCNTSTPLPGFGAESLPGGLDGSGNQTYFYGLVEFVSKIDKLTEDLDLPKASQTMTFQFRNVHPHPSMADAPVFAYSDDAPPESAALVDPVVVPISMPEISIEWELVAVPKGGWSSTSTLYIIAMISVYGGLVVSSISFFVMEAKSMQLKAALALAGAIRDQVMKATLELV